MKGGFLYATFEELKEGKTTDIYFVRTRKILQAYGLDKVRVYAEFTASSLPEGYPWAVFCGLRDVLTLLEGVPVDVYALPEGTVFFGRDFYGVREPLMGIEGPYGEFVVYETPALGFLCMGSGIATKAARIKRAAGDALVLSFGARRTHPAISPFAGYYAYIGGCDAVSCIKAAEFLGIKPTGTMPHSLMIIFRAIKGDHALAWRAFDEVVEKDVPRIMLVDTFLDETAETERAVKMLGDRVWGVRLDTPGSRRGDFAEIVREVKWRLKLMGRGDVKIVVSGGIDEKVIPDLRKAGVDAFGVGTAISNARIVDIAMDLVEVEVEGVWKPISKRGKYPGRKQLYRCEKCFVDVVASWRAEAPKCPKCGGEMKPLLVKFMEQGKIVREIPPPQKVREYVLEQVAKLDLDSKPW